MTKHPQDLPAKAFEPFDPDESFRWPELGALVPGDSLLWEQKALRKARTLPQVTAARTSLDDKYGRAAGHVFVDSVW